MESLRSPCNTDVIRRSGDFSKMLSWGNCGFDCFGQGTTGSLLPNCIHCAIIRIMELMLIGQRQEAQFITLFVRAAQANQIETTCGMVLCRI